LEPFFSYAASLFWTHPPRNCYGPVWGGVLNPVVGALFFVGLIDGLQKINSRFFQWVFMGLALLFLPAFFSKQYETFRIILMFPFLMMIAAWGLGTLALRLNKNRLLVVSFVLLLSALLDAYHLFGHYHAAWGEPNQNWYYLKSTTSYRAYKVLDDAQKRSGAGMVLSDFQPSVGEQTLNFAVFPFDSAHNPRIPFQETQWAAILVRPDYKPFLKKRFPGLNWFDLGRDHPWDPDDLWLGILPITETNREDMRRWFEAEKGFQKATSAAMYARSRKNIEWTLDSLFRSRALLGKDPFLESIFWEKVIFFYCVVEKDKTKALESISQYLKYGLPCPWIYRLKNQLTHPAAQDLPEPAGA
jgi:hypothetical protein